ncbi:MAG: hypothetical protein J2O46_00615, partial [Nocardioides sp.]|nr:hypothetical protein [Nocardioides sp.]
SDDGDEVSGSGSAYHVDVEEGGQKSCITMSASVTYPWGTTKTSEGNACGTAKAKRLWWVKMPKCTAPGIPCFTWELHYEGFKLLEPYPLKLAQKGGDCHSASGRCSQTIYATAKTGTWAEWTAPKNWHDPFTATVDGVTAKIPN